MTSRITVMEQCLPHSSFIIFGYVTGKFCCLSQQNQLSWWKSIAWTINANKANSMFHHTEQCQQKSIIYARDTSNMLHRKTEDALMQEHQLVLPCTMQQMPKTMDVDQGTKRTTPDSKVHGANMGTTWVLSAPDGPHVSPMNLAIRDRNSKPLSKPLYSDDWDCNINRQYVQLPKRPYNVRILFLICPALWESIRFSNPQIPKS